MDLFTLRTNFQLLNRILTILLHLCCSSASPRVAHDSTIMRSDHFCDCNADKSFCSGKHLYKSKLLSTFLAFESLSRRRNCSMKSAAARADLSQKCCILLSGIQRLVQMLAMALASVNASRTQPKRLGIISIRSCCACDANPRCVTLLAHVAWSRLPFAAHTNTCALQQDMFATLLRCCHRTFRCS